MDRLRRALFPLALLVAMGVGAALLVEQSHADLENQVFTSKADNLRLVVPRGWRASDQPSYPGLLLWMMRSQPQGQIVLTGEAFTRELYCSWPVACRTSHDLLPGKYACALRQKLGAQRLRVGPVQPGPKENELAGLPSVWFEYDDGKHFLRQAIAMSEARAVSLVLTASSTNDRTAHGRAFEQVLRSISLLSASGSGAPVLVVEDAAVLPDSAPVPSLRTAPGDGALGPDAQLLPDAAPGDAGPMFISTPVPEAASPIGPCP